MTRRELVDFIVALHMPLAAAELLIERILAEHGPLDPDEQEELR